LKIKSRRLRRPNENRRTDRKAGVGRMKVKISDVIRIQEERIKINSVPLSFIEWIDDNGNVLEIPSKIVDRFEMIGLNNVDFIISGEYLKGWDGNENNGTH
jgi:hypothetical protein